MATVSAAKAFMARFAALFRVPSRQSRDSKGGLTIPSAQTVTDSLEDRSSITDQGRYLEICSLAASDPMVFARFRQETAYLEVLDHVLEQEGAEYLSVIERDSPHLLREELATFRANDLFGSPNMYEYPGVGSISPTTLRYIKVVGDLERLFGSLVGKKIIEIGVGYGGQCRLVTAHWRLQSYTLVDLAPALDLARVYLAKFDTPNVASSETLYFRSSDEDIQGQFDLCISNYAFTELSRAAQSRYVAMILQQSRAGYMTCNFISTGFGIDSMTADELISLHPGAEWLSEEPLTHPDNRILVWGHRDRT